jgi:hypothetical protein
MVKAEFVITILQFSKLKIWLLDNGCKRVASEEIEKRLPVETDARVKSRLIFLNANRQN